MDDCVPVSNDQSELLPAFGIVTPASICESVQVLSPELAVQETDCGSEALPNDEQYNMVQQSTEFFIGDADTVSNDGFGSGSIQMLNTTADYIDTASENGSLDNTPFANQLFHDSADTFVIAQPKIQPRPNNSAIFPSAGRDIQELMWRNTRSQNHATLVPTLQYPWEKNVAEQTRRSIPVGEILSHAQLASIVHSLDNRSCDEPLLKKPKLAFAARCVNRLGWEESEDLLRQRALNRWRIIVEIDLTSTSFGRSLIEEFNSLEAEDRLVLSFRDVFARKSTATLVKRSSSLLDFLKWATQHGMADPLLLRESNIYQYMCHLRIEQSAATKAASFISALRFAQHTLGLSGVSDALSARVLGASSAMFTKKAPLRQSVPLTVEHVKLLESVVISSADIMSRVAAGYFCFCLFSCARFKDGMFLSELELDMPMENFGFVEAKTLKHKTATSDQKRTTFLPIVSFARGLSRKPWATQWLRDRNTLGFDGMSFTLPAPLRNNRWATRPLTSGEGSQWLREILQSAGASEFESLTTHSLKCTLLTWAAKSNPPVTLEHRRLLGHHMDAANTSALTYSRDAMSAPLQVMEQVLESIRQGVFRPDDTRATRAAEARQCIQTEQLDISLIQADHASDLRDQYPEVDSESCESVSSIDEVRDEIDESRENETFEAIGKTRKQAVVGEGIFVNKHSGLGHKIKDDGLRFVCGKLLSLSYASSTTVSGNIIMCLGCEPSA